jgi:hypothetical protein
MTGRDGSNAGVRHDDTQKQSNHSWLILVHVGRAFQMRVERDDTAFLGSPLDPGLNERAEREQARSGGNAFSARHRKERPSLKAHPALEPAESAPTPAVKGSSLRQEPRQKLFFLARKVILHPAWVLGDFSPQTL